MIERHDSPEETPGINQLSYPIPNPVDLVVIEYVDSRPQHYQPIEIDTPHSENARTGLNLRLTWQGPSSADPEKMVRVYTSGRTCQDVYNFALEYSAESNAGPIFVRSYLERRDNYLAQGPLPKGQPLTGVTGLRLTNGGSGYTSNPTVEFDGDGSGAAAEAIVIDGVVVTIRLTSEGTGYPEAPTVALVGGGGSGAAASATIQPVSAVLVKEEAKKIVDEVPEMNREWNEAMLGGLFLRVNRIYETLPGPWIPGSRWDDNLGPIHITKRAVLKTTPQQEATSGPSFKRTFESREGSTIVSMEIFESWGEDPYAHRFAVEIPDRIPMEFRDLLPTRTIEQTEVGLAEEPVLAPGQLAASSTEVNKFWRHQSVTGRDLTRLPITRHDFDLDEIQAGGSGFGGVFDNARTLAEGALPIEEGFTIIASSVKDLGNELKLRETKRLSGALPARLLLTFPGSGFSSDPAVVFNGGNVGSGADATAVLSSVPVIPPTGEVGGVFNLDFEEAGDANGVFTFLGARYNGGVWRNPATAGNVAITAKTHPAYPVSQAVLANLVDHSASDRVTVIPQPGGGHYIAFDLGVGKRLKPNGIAIRQAAQLTSGQRQHYLRIEGFNDFVSGTVVGPALPIPQTPGDWSHAGLDNSVGYRYFRIFGIDDSIPGTEPSIFPALILAEIELYGELTIEAGVELGYSFDGDTHGVFHYLGALGNNGVWRNPHANGDIICAADDLTGPSTLDQLVDRQPSNITQGAGAGKSYSFDLLAGRRLVCNGLSVRQRTGSNGALSFNLQGWNGSDPPTDLATVAVAASSDAWTSIEVPGTTAYQHFRIISAFPFFSIGEVELYGALTFPAVAPTGTFAIQSVTINDGGSGYVAPPFVSFEGGGGTGAAGTAVLNDDGVVTSVAMTNHGSGYTTVPDVIFSSVGAAGGGAAATAIIDGQVTAVDVDDGGADYEVPPDVVFDGGPGAAGSGAAADAVLGFGLDAITVGTPGSGYGSPPTVEIDPPNGAAHSILSHALDSIAVDDGGSGYSAPPTVVIDAPTGAGGVQATAHAVMGSGGTTETLAYLSDGDANGVFYRIGEDFGGHAWANPQSNGLAVSSNVAPQFGTSLTNLTNRTSDAVILTNAANDSITFDLGAGRSLEMTDWLYRSRGDDTTALPTEMTLEGSNNGSTWFAVDLQTGLTPAGAGDWLLFTLGAPSTAYRYFRVTQSANNSDGNGFFTAGEFEFYGDLTYGATAGVDEVESVVIDNPGFGYLVTPAVSFTGDGSGAAGTATLEALGVVDSVVIDDPGVFETPPDITFDGGGGAAATATLLAGGTVMRVDVTAPGTNYQGAPGVTFEPVGADPGTGAAATASIEGEVTSFTLTDGGAGYDTAPTVQIPGDATATATVAGGAVTSVTVVDGGSGYDEPPPVVFAPVGGPEGEATIAFGVGAINVSNGGSGYPSAPPVDIVGDGRSASAYSILGRSLLRIDMIAYGRNYGSTVHAAISAPGGSGGAVLTVQRKFGIESVTVNTPGTGYVTDPLVTAPSPEGTDAIFRAIRGLPLGSVNVSDGGSGYTSAPTATFAGPFGAGTTATGTAILGFGVDSIDMDSMGSGYATTPNVELRSSDGTGGGATAIAELLGRTLQTIGVDVGGSGYSSPPDVIIGDGTNGAAHAVLTGDAVTSIVIDDPGSFFSSAPAITFSGGGGTLAAATAVITTLNQMRIVVTNPGGGYEAAPDVIITLGGGTGAAATATLAAAGTVKRVDLTLNGTNYIDNPIIVFSSGGGTGAAAIGIRNLAAAGPVALVAVLQPGDGYVAATVACVFSGGGGSGAAATAVKKTLGSIKSVTITNVGAGYVDPPLVIIGEDMGGIGEFAIARAILATTGKVKSVVITSPGEGYTVAPAISFPASVGSGAVATASLTETGSINTLVLTVPGGPFSVAPLVSFLPTGSAPLATALYLLGQVWPTLYDEFTDPSDKIVVLVTKDIVVPETELPPGYSELKALNKYRTIQMVSKLDLHRWPPVERYLTTQHIGLPNLLTGILPVWSTRTAENHSVDGHGVSGNAGATAEISGSILVLKKGGFRGAAISLVERTHFNGIPPDSSVPPVSIIRPSTGTAFLKGGANTVSREGALVGQVLNIHGQPAQIGDIIGYDPQGLPIILSGYVDPSWGIRTGSSNSVSSNVQIVDISDVLTSGLVFASINGVEQDSGAGTAHALDVHAAVQGTFGANMPPSCPAQLSPGSTILQEVGVEKFRFNRYVRTIVYVTVPADCPGVGFYGPEN